MASFIVYYYLLLSVIEFVVTIVGSLSLSLAVSLLHSLHCVAKLWGSQEYNEFCIWNIIYACSQHALPSALLHVPSAFGHNRVACFGPMKMLINSCDRKGVGIAVAGRLHFCLIAIENHRRSSYLLFNIPVPPLGPAWVLVPASTFPLYQISMLRILYMLSVRYIF